MSPLTNFILFLKTPNTKKIKDLYLIDRVLEIFTLYLVKITLSIFIAILLKLLIAIENTSISNLKHNWPFFKLVLLGGLLMPVAEEIVFRLSLIFSPKNLFLSSFFLGYATITRLYFNTSLFDTEYEFITRIFISFVISFSFYFIAVKNKTFFEAFWETHFKWILYSLIFIFGFLHIENFNVSSLGYFWTPLIILPQCFSGSVYSYIRIKHGFTFSCVLHIANNLFVILI